MSKTTKIVLIVCGVIGACCILVFLLFLVIARPGMEKVMHRAHETSVIASLRVLNSAEVEYSATYPERGFACTLPTLGGSPQSGAPSPEAAQIIGDDLVTGTKAGYTFVLTCTTKTTMKNQDTFTGYRITAVPTALHQTGDRGFCTDQDAQIKFDPTGGTNCTELLQ